MVHPRPRSAEHCCTPRHTFPEHEREALGLATGAALTKRGLATVTKGNRFVLKAKAGERR